MNDDTLPLAADDDGRVNWFGKSWDSPVNAARQVPVPVGVRCTQCSQKLKARDSGFLIMSFDHGEPVRIAYHRDCFLPLIVAPSEAE